MNNIHTYYIKTRSKTEKRESIIKAADFPFLCPESTDTESKPSLFHKEIEPV
jgi:hypothetical protein